MWCYFFRNTVAGRGEPQRSSVQIRLFRPKCKCDFCNGFAIFKRSTKKSESKIARVCRKGGFEMNMYSGRWSDTNQLPYPVLADLLKLSADGVDGLAYTLNNSVEISKENDYGQLALELVILLLKQISSKMSPGQTLEDYFS